MVKYNVDQIHALMNLPSQIRNISVIAHVDHGKTTLTDSLISKVGIISEDKAGTMRVTDNLKAEQERGITIKSTSISLYYEKEEEEEKKEAYLINLIDCPGHVDFSSEVTAALRVTDGALVVVDCIEGVCVQTETVLRQAMNERIKPILFLNKLDRIFLETQSSLEQSYNDFRKSIESVNVICSIYEQQQDNEMKMNNADSIELLPSTGKVGFGSGLQSWAFTLDIFADMYSSKFGMKKSSLMKKLWGDNYYSYKKKKWITKSDDMSLQRGFCQFVLLPIKTLFNAIINNDESIYQNIIKYLNLKIKQDDYKKYKTNKQQKDLLKLIMRSWLPAGDCLFNMIINHLPSPIIAQKYRINNLYTGPLDSEEASAISSCNINGPMSMYISKMIHDKGGRFIAFGRVFSGVVKTGQEVRILGPEYQYGKKNDLFVNKKILGTLLMMGKYHESIINVPCGNVCGIIGIENYLLKSGTITNSENIYPFQTMKFNVAAIVQIAIKPKDPQNLPHLIEGLKKLSKSDPLIKISTTNNGENIISGAGSLHLDICLGDLKEYYMNNTNIELITSEPIVPLSETITSYTGCFSENENESQNSKYPKICVSKSPNKLNRLYMTSEPLIHKYDHLLVAMEKQEIKLANYFNNNKMFAKELHDKYKLNLDDAKKIWTFGCPPDGIPNMIIDKTKGISYMNEIRDHVVGAFMEVTRQGVLCEEVMRGIRFNVEDAKIHSDPVHRGASQIGPCSKKAIYACQIASSPKLMEPMYLIEINVPKLNCNGAYESLSMKRGIVDAVIEKQNNIVIIKAFLPVLESFNFTDILREKTKGTAFPQMKFSHWQCIDQDPFKQGTFSNKLLMETRKRKGLKMELPNFNDYYDRI